MIGPKRSSFISQVDAIMLTRMGTEVLVLANTRGAAVMRPERKFRTKSDCLSIAQLSDSDMKPIISPILWLQSREVFILRKDCER
jgi:hypothetical protein